MRERCGTPSSSRWRTSRGQQVYQTHAYGHAQCRLPPASPSSSLQHGDCPGTRRRRCRGPEGITPKRGCNAELQHLVTNQGEGGRHRYDGSGQEGALRSPTWSPGLLGVNRLIIRHYTSVLSTTGHLAFLPPNYLHYLTLEDAASITGSYHIQGSWRVRLLTILMVDFP